MNPFLPAQLFGREAELTIVSQILADDGDLLLAGVPGIGRRRLMRSAAQRCRAKVVEIDCLRATDYRRFIQLLAEGILATFNSAMELSLIQRWSQQFSLILDTNSTGQPKLLFDFTKGEEWPLLQAFLALPQILAEWLDCRVVLVFQSFPHIRSWDRQGKWEHYLRQEIQLQTRVSYAIIATVAEKWTEQSALETVLLGPLSDRDLRNWLELALASGQLALDEEAIGLFLSYVQGHFGDAIALVKRIWVDHRGSGQIVRAHQVYRSAVSLIEDLAVTFESLILLLPNSQVRVLESLALDPTDSPHAKEYIQKHHLSRGGTLQGALSSLEQKGLIYGADYGYRIALPMLGLWLKHRLG
ncbi:AAA family ATPase [Alkalinema pantanalense CENA528]|uniref:AAA family ATPase n=1 Tax=Alkalinema pantanalense TaxID=1620705 RepID=UPI003D6DFA37